MSATENLGPQFDQPKLSKDELDELNKKIAKKLPTWDDDSGELPAF